MTRQKNKIITFFFSLIPGAGQMYLGFMKRGLSLTLYAVIICCAAMILYMPGILILLPPVWLYAFFDALNLNSCEYEDFRTIEDDYITFDFIPNLRSPLLENINKRFWGKSLIFMGSMFLIYNGLQVLGSFAYDMDHSYIGWIINDILNYAPRFVIAVILIIMGKSLVWGNKQKAKLDEEIIEKFAEDKKEKTVTEEISVKSEGIKEELSTVTTKEELCEVSEDE